jgi:hypothetical protein
MKSGIAKGGYERFKRTQEDVTPEIKKKKREALEKKYAQLIAAAKPHEKEQLYERMTKELLLQDHEPSAAALW